MNNPIYEYDDYKKYLLDRLEASPGKGRGLRRQMAEYMNCQVAYVSHVLAADRHFSLEQGEALSRFFALRADETEYFLLLIEFCRAGTPGLKKFFQQQIQNKRVAFRDLKKRIKYERQILPEDQITYYSSWHYQAVRMLLTIPEYRKAPEIARKLGISVERALEILSFFVAKGLAKEDSGGYKTTETKIHLGRDSGLLNKMHSNWRVHTLQKLDCISEDDLHYSAAVTLSKSDYDKVREILTNALVNTHKVIHPSKEERLCVLAMDFYEV